MRRHNKPFSFAPSYENLRQILIDHKLASLGAAYINFAYSLALSNTQGKSMGTRVKGATLAMAFRKAGLRNSLPSRMTRYSLADAAETLIVYAWLQDHITLQETIAILERNKGPVDGFSQILTTIMERIKFS